jgi:hypothetical protein
VYGTVELTPFAGFPENKLPVFEALEQFKLLIAPGGVATERFNVHPRPPILKEKLAVPGPDGIPVIE